jgi:aspartate aminotransferase
LCSRYKIVVLADEIYMDLHDEDYYSIAKYYPEGTILSTGLSKWAGAGGWRIGALLFPPQLKDLLRVVVGIASESFSSVAAPIQHAAVVAFNGGPEIDEYLRRTRCVIRTMAAEVVRILRDGGVTVADPNGPFYVFPDFGAFRGNLNRRGIYTSSEMTQYVFALLFLGIEKPF